MAELPNEIIEGIVKNAKLDVLLELIGKYEAELEKIPDGTIKNLIRIPFIEALKEMDCVDFENITQRMHTDL